MGKVLEIQKEVDVIRDDIEKEFLQCLDELGYGRSGLADLFAEFDEHKEGSISMAQFRRGLEKMQIHISNHRFLLLLRIIDMDRTGSVTFQDFCRLAFPEEMARQDQEHRDHEYRRVVGLSRLPSRVSRPRAISVRHFSPQSIIRE